MKTTKHKTETYILSDLERLDPVTVFVKNIAPGQGKIVIECYGQAWANYWGGMGDQTLQEFFVRADNDYISGKMLKEISQTDFDEINKIAHREGFDFSVDSDVEIAMQSADMAECFGPDWYMDLPTCHTSEYEYLGRILNAIKAAFSEEMQAA